MFSTLTSTSHRNLRAYRQADDLATELFWITRRFPREGRPTLVDQLRCYARAVPAQVATAWAQRHDPPTFCRALEEALETSDLLAHWLNVARACHCLTEDEHRQLMHRQATLKLSIARLQLRCTTTPA